MTGVSPAGRIWVLAVLFVTPLLSGCAAVVVVAAANVCHGLNRDWVLDRSLPVSEPVGQIADVPVTLLVWGMEINTPGQCRVAGEFYYKEQLGALDVAQVDQGSAVLRDALMSRTDVAACESGEVHAALQSRDSRRIEKTWSFDADRTYVGFRPVRCEI